MPDETLNPPDLDTETVSTSAASAPPAPVSRRPKRVVHLRKQRTQEEMEDDRGDLNEDDDTPMTEEQKALFELQQVLESNDLVGGTCRIERRGPTDTGFAYLGKIKTNIFDLEMIKRVYGGGDYSAQFFRANGQIARKITFSIDPRFRGSMDINELPAGLRNDNNSGGSNKMTEMLAAAVIADKKSDPAQAQLMQVMMKTQQESTNLLMTMMMKSAETQAQMMAGMMTAMASAFGAKGSAAPGGLGMQDVVALVTLLRGSEGKQLSLLEMTQALKNLKEISSGDGGEEAPQSTLDKLVATIPHIASTVKALKGVPDNPPASSDRALPSGNQQIEAESGAQVSDIEASLQLVVSAARRNSDVTLYHDVFMDALTDEQIPMLKGILTQDNWFTTLFGKLKDGEQLKPWLTNLRNLIVEELSPEVKPDAGAATGQPDPAGVRSGENPEGAGTNP